MTPPDPSNPTTAPDPNLDLQIYIDGASRGNPGPAGGGVVLKGPDGKTAHEIIIPFGRTTNNVAEYGALISSLEESRRRGARKIRIYSDSLLLVNQMTGLYRVRNERILPLWNAAQALIKHFDAWEIRHIPRKANKEADRLANMAASRSEAGEGSGREGIPQL